MITRTLRTSLAAVLAAGLLAAGTGAAVGHGQTGSTRTTAADGPTREAKVVPLKDARLKFEINATDRDGGVQVFIDADSWKEISVFDPAGVRVLTTTTSGRMAEQGGTELFLESAEPPFTTLPIAKLLQRFPQGRYTIRGTGLGGESYVGSAFLSHSIPAGPRLVSPLGGQRAPLPGATTVRWRPVAPPKGSAIIGYQVLVVQPRSGLRALPKITLDVTMPPTATSLRVPPGFLRPRTEYEWEVLAIERNGNQTLSSSSFTTGR